MPSDVDIANRALSAIGTRSQIASLEENSNEAKQARLLITPCREEILRLAPWNCARNYNNLALICAAPGTPENPATGMNVWQKGIPAPPWSYEYAYPVDCVRAVFIVPQFSTGFSNGVPITTAVTGGAPQFWNGPPVKFQVAIDQIGTDGLPANVGSDTRVILTNQEQAILCYVKDVSDPNVMDQQLIQAWVAVLAARLVFALTGDKGLANIKISEANGYIQTARAGDGNEGLTINDVTPDWIRTRGIDFISGGQWGPGGWLVSGYDWGGFISTY
jgi:hypothetical protein